MFASAHSLLEIVLRTSLIYAALLVGMRVSGKREIGQMTVFDLVMLLLIANAVQNAMTGPDTSLTGGLAAAATLIVVNTVVTQFAWKSKSVRHWVEGTPTLLIHHGELVTANLIKEKLTQEELYQALREHGIADPAQVALAMLEVDGSISVLRTDEMPAVPKPHHRIRFLKRKS